jgi:hypothetical protein
VTGLSSSPKKPPSDVNQWAADAFSALEKALIAFEEDYPAPEPEERLEIVGYAAELAASARGISNSAEIDAADEYAIDNVLADLESESVSEEAEPDYAILFLLCYLDAHVHFGLLKEDRIEPIIQALITEYDLTIR